MPDVNPTVFVLLGVWSYEGSEIIGVFNSFDKAREAQITCENAENDYRNGNMSTFLLCHDYFTIEERAVQ